MDCSFNSFNTVKTVLTRGMFVKTVYTVVKTVAIITKDKFYHTYYFHKSWTIRKNKETRLNAFEMKGLTVIWLVSRTAKNPNEWVLEAAKSRQVFDTVKCKKLYIMDKLCKSETTTWRRISCRVQWQEAKPEVGHTRPGGRDYQ